VPLGLVYIFLTIQLVLIPLGGLGAEGFGDWVVVSWKCVEFVREVKLRKVVKWERTSCEEEARCVATSGR